MNKYNPLWSRIGKSKEVNMQLSFEEIEEVLGFPIDHSFLQYKIELFHRQEG